MTAQVIDGRAVADEIRSQVEVNAQALLSRQLPVKLVALQVGDNPSSLLYTNMQRRNCESAGIDYELRTLKAETTEAELIAAIEAVNEDPEATGLILQLPLPPHIEARDVQQCILPAKDVEAIHPWSLGTLFLGFPDVAPCTPMAAVELLRRATTDWAGKEAVVVGHSEIVGKPIAAILLASRDAAPTVTVCHVATRDLAEHTRRADILFVAVGKSQRNWLNYRQAHGLGQQPDPPDLTPLITADMIKPGAVVVDVAINRIPVALDETGEPVTDEKHKAQMKTVGDVDFEAAREVASAITPVPGGVGPVTVAILLRNVVTCARAMAEGTRPQ